MDPSLLNTLTFSLADNTFEELLTNTFSAKSLNSSSKISTFPVA